ncbi:hormogonium polysaccharide secretion pseudopilin HpsC [Microcoleus sp. Pol12A4]|uniref:hormogonium polysaccharide secretion pseudopilin HpsC n=1 Tax=Microcoleus sp. Pol12A4 TaxID=3055391 RepID=UPI002FD6D641
MKTLLRLLLKSQHQRNRSGPAQTEKGMTLVELLVGAIMAFLIITPMLGFVVDMLNTDRREQVKSNTEQDIQAAVDFIAQDLSQAIYIYDNNPATTSTATTTATGIPALLAGQFIPPADTTQTPILVFWKRRQIKNAVPVNATLTPKPSNCNPAALPGTAGECNDTYVLSLVAYYQLKDQQNTWCQPSGGICPTRIARYEIRDGVKNPSSSDPANPYYTVDPKEAAAPHEAFNKEFDISKPTEKVTLGTAKFINPEVLVNYIDHGTKPELTGNECRTALGNPTTQTGIKTSFISEDTLKVTDRKNNITSFYACVDTERNVARVTIRGNSLRRLQTDADYDANKSAYFPTATVQVQGLGGLGK